MELKIYDTDGTLKLTASPGSSSTVTDEVMGECCVSASFTHTAFVPLDVNDYAEVLGVRYKVRSPYRPTQKNTQTYQYNVKLYAPIHDAEDALMLYTADGDIRSEFSFDGGPREHLQLWVDNMNRIAGAAVWSIGTVVTGENKTIDYTNLSCWDAAFGSQGIAATFETELWADGFTVNLCKAARGETVELGYLQGLTRLAQEDNGEVKFFTRLFPLGSTRNIDASKYGHARLQLPSGAVYVDKNTDLYGVKEGYEEAAFADIFPKYIGTISSVRTEEKENEEGRAYTVYYFKDSGMTFNPMDYQIPDLTFMLAFQTGDLAGRGGGEDGSFEAAWHEDTREWEITNTYPDEETQVPGGAIVPAVGDTYIPWNFSLPEQYVTAAEQAYAEAVDDFLATYSFDPKKYSGITDRNYTERNHTPLAVGQNVRLLSTEYFTTGYKDTRIVKCVRRLNDLCQATITCTDQIGTGWKTSVDNRLSDLHYILSKQQEQTLIDIIKTGDNKTPSDYNVFSALLSLAMFLRKDKEDSTQYLMRFFGGLDVGSYVPGLLGTGIRLKDGKMEADELTLRKRLTVPELVYNRVRVVGNEMWVTEGGEVAEVVADGDSTDNLYWIRLKETDGNVACPFWEDDILRGIVHVRNAEGAFAGFYTVMLRVVAIADDQTFSVVPQTAGMVPVEGLVLARQGNFTNTERQRAIYLSSELGCIRFLEHVDGWDIEPRMIYMQLGTTAGAVIPGLEDLPGYNALLNNVVARGSFIQISSDQTTEGRIPFYKGAWQAGQTYYYYDEVTWNGCRYLCIATSTTAQPAYDSTDWLMTEGDNRFTLEIDSSAGFEFYHGELDTVLTARIRAGMEEITGSVASSHVKWTRQSGDAASDTIWDKAHEAYGTTLPLTMADVPQPRPDYVTFTCEATVSTPDRQLKLTEQITI